MFCVRHKETGKLETVYALNGLQFLFYNKETGSWYFDYMGNYRPYEVQG